MKTTAAALFICFLATSAVAIVTDTSVQHPLYGKWAWTYTKNNCTEVYDYRPDNTSVVTSGEEIGESHFTVGGKPDLNGFYRMMDVVTKRNDCTGCDGGPGGTPIGDTVTFYIFFHLTKSEMIICKSRYLMLAWVRFGVFPNDL